MKDHRLNDTEKGVLVTGGTGYIGSHAVVTLIAAGYNPVIVDNLSNSKVSALERISKITKKKLPFYKIDMRDSAALDKVFQKHPIASVIHFAGLKAVGESVAEPLRYYENNIQSAISLCFVMAKRGVKKIIFSSSAAVYGDASIIPISENCFPEPTNPYARSKIIIEQILQDIHVADPAWRVILLRYFNPVGAHQSGLIGEDPQGTPNNLMPLISQVAVGRRKRINIFGDDYPTTDGTGVRDYIHVMDLAEGHIAALKQIEKTALKKSTQKPMIINLGTGRGYTVMEMLHAFEEVSGKKIPYRITKRRPGDIAACYADTTLARKLLGWKARRGLVDMCADAWRWQSRNPQGYP
ncbi:MAG: UDP-glucose 4-epimerase GalE [Deltaproteobacteria bacterium]|nr:UDP-glucose 4-epimerase GalE [Deltaproteobacteria bacterium]